MAHAANPARAASRRGFLTKALIGAAVLGGLSAAMQRKVFGKAAVPPLRLPEDSIFTPRADQRARVLGE